MLKTRYRFGVAYFVFFIPAMLLQLAAYVSWGGDGVIRGFWFTVIILGMGLANMTSLIWQAQMRWAGNRQGQLEMSKRLNWWWIVVLGFAAAWFIVFWFVLPTWKPELYPTLTGMLTTVYLIVGGLSYLLYVIGYPRSE